jgi:hypothetical protein
MRINVGKAITEFFRVSTSIHYVYWSYPELDVCCDDSSEEDKERLKAVLIESGVVEDTWERSNNRIMRQAQWKEKA